MVVLIALLDGICLTCIGTFVSKRLKDDYTSSVFVVSGIISFDSLIITIFQLFIFPYLSKVMFIPHMMLLGYSLQCLGWILFTFKQFSTMLCGLIFHVLGYGLTASSPSVVASVYIYIYLIFIYLF